MSYRFVGFMEHWGNLAGLILGLFLIVFLGGCVACRAVRLVFVIGFFVLLCVIMGISDDRLTVWRNV